MSTDVTLLFLHGIGEGDKGETWATYLSDALSEIGYPGLEGVNRVSPQYAHALKGWDHKEDLPAVTMKPLARDAARKNRRNFERRTSAIEFRLGRHDRGNGYIGGDALVSASVMAGGLGIPRVAQAHNYLKDPQIRAQVLNGIIAQLPTTGRLVIVGYSLGSVIAADLITRLPVGLKVDGLLTLGSPLANGNFSTDELRKGLEDPPMNLSWWVNFWNTGDPVAAHRGVSSVFPWLVDFRISTEKVLLGAHDAGQYLSSAAVATAIGYALFGSRSREIDKSEKAVDIPLDDAEVIAILALRYAHLLKAQLVGETYDRFRGALRHVQAAVVDGIRERNFAEGREIALDIACLAFDLSDAQSEVPVPTPITHVGKDKAAMVLTVLAAENVIRPFEISIPTDKWRRAMQDLTFEMKLGSQFGADIFDAAKQAQEALSPDRQVNWVRWGALGVGAAAIIVATGGVALAAAPGVVGAAAITSALAAFGPGGMIGGLLTAGTLISAGGGGIALGLASQGTTAEALESVLVRRLTLATLRQSHNLAPDLTQWGLLVETEIQVRREYERLDEFSDDSALTLRELKRKIDAIERALKYLTKIGLEPGVHK